MALRAPTTATLPPAPLASSAAARQGQRSRPEHPGVGHSAAPHVLAMHRRMEEGSAAGHGVRVSPGWHKHVSLGVDPPAAPSGGDGHARP